MAETGGTAGTENMAETGSRVASGCRAEAVAVGVAAAAVAAVAAAAVSGRADSAPKVLAGLLLSVVLAEASAAEAGLWVWLGGTESESAVGS